MKSRTAVQASIGVVAALTLAACGGGNSSSSAGPVNLTIALSSAPNSLDPAQVAVGPFLNYMDPAYASLLGRKADGTLEAGLADKWGYVGSGNTKFQLSLRKGAKFSDGTPITAADVVSSFKYFQKGSGPTASYFRPLTFSTPDSSTVVVTSPTPNPDMGTLFTPSYMGGAIISPAGLKTPAKLASTTFGAGPYVLSAQQSVSGDHYVYVPNKNFYDKAAVHFKKITVKVMPNVNSQVQALKSGQIDLMYGTPDVAPTIAGDKSLTTLTKPSTWAGLYLLDRSGTIVKGLGDVRVRQALNFAIDRAAITKAVYGEFGSPVSQPAMPGYDGYSPEAEKMYPYDPAKAKQLLEEAGYSKGLTIPVNYGSFDPSTTKMLQAVQDQLSKVGVTLKLQAAANFGGWINDLVSKKYPATVLSPGAGGEENFYAQQAGFTKTGIMNVFGVADQDVDAAFSRLATADPKSSGTAAKDLTDVIVRKALALPVSGTETIAMYNSKLQGVQFPKSSAQLTSNTTWTTR
ncbi:ABC transporter substrate-binding protein [Streptomyces turgidiscabies]|uniref:ABC transporter, substrate-binding protein, family 5 n=1 Tax=Streptomyces turgidiscabies (strain Car8) TaxID=698760 RepID=L7FAV8_STRT8|nr:MULTISPECIES: ABC transporter substrate-binding protein [Streptomyces]ELP67800.1 ABC transporter, substrate-binding protein, family 5 [Streptomyces turgidiscabies Car8]MDX3496573.1 ABC transporter substrate-binding protein [Streptomyces turgidiscabies]GAQ72769.1 putative D,D-dipeptide-binding periplasmic protein DdpA precursor [Streptomyces turgidiscabies]